MIILDFYIKTKLISYNIYNINYIQIGKLRDKYE